MLFPNKLYPFQRTMLKKSIFILKTLKISEVPVHVLYSKVNDRFDNIFDFKETLDLLFILDKIELKGDLVCYIK